MPDRLYSKPIPPRRFEDFTSDEVDSYRKKCPSLTQSLTNRQVQESLARKEELENRPDVQAFNARVRSQQRKN